MAEYVPKTVKDVPSHQFVVQYAAHLKSADKLQLPAWADLVKTGTFKELGPLDPDWYYTRAASIARLVYLRQDVGVGALRKRYGGAKGDGVCTYHHAKSAGGLIRHILKQLEDIGIVEKSDNTKGGRRITPQGQRDLDLIAGRVEIPTTAAA